MSPNNKPTGGKGEKYRHFVFSIFIQTLFDFVLPSKLKTSNVCITASSSSGGVDHTPTGEEFWGGHSCPSCNCPRRAKFGQDGSGLCPRCVPPHVQCTLAHEGALHDGSSRAPDLAPRGQLPYLHQKGKPGPSTRSTCK